MRPLYNSGDIQVLEFVIGTQKAHSTEDVLNALVRFKENYRVDIAVQEETYFRRNKRLISSFPLNSKS